ncbi:hypothetical protein PR202_gb12944 [Eleusine coracana subsp. coracana]|uniref:NAC domain-containing protein n=1 Tax=Eleusine coracana subsp. coracana TaxID=191504 RepID=A0AAV5ERR6_ELECO|nr:hypothetical protein PR202_gb12944 [Eleusine coracana subsp. coracana]
MASSIPLASGASIPMPPGYKFIPSDEDIVVRYLRCRALNQPLPSAFITDKDILNHNPWDLLPGAFIQHIFYTQWFHLFAPSASDICVAINVLIGFFLVSIARCRGGGRSRIQLLVGLKRTQVFYLGKAPAVFSSKNFIVSHQVEDHLQKHDDPADALHGTAPSIENTPILLNPDESWVVCRIHKSRKRTPPVVIGSSSCPGEENIPFFDFLGVGNHDQGSANTSTQAESLIEVENSEVEGNGGTSEMASTSNGN